MSARARILMIRLMEGIEKYPAYARALGIEATGAGNHQNEKTESKSLTGV